MTNQQQAQVFKALCDDKRIAILNLLKGRQCCACTLIQQLDIAQSALSYHMKILCDSGLVVSRTQGKWVHYAISPQGVEVAHSILYGLTQGDNQ